MRSKEQFHLGEISPAFLWLEVNDLGVSLIPIKVNNWFSLVRIDLLSLHDWSFAIVLSNDQFCAAIVTTADILLWEKGRHVIAVSINVSDIVRSVAARASSSSHECLNEDVLIHSHVKYAINLKVLLEHLCLVQCSGNSIEDEGLLILIVSLACFQDDFDYRFIVDEVSLVDLLLDCQLPGVHCLWLGRCDATEIVTSREHGDAEFLLD